MTDERFENLCELIGDLFNEYSDSKAITRLSVIMNVICSGKNLIRYYEAEPERGLNNLITFLQMKIEEKLLTDREAIILLQIILSDKRSLMN